MFRIPIFASYRFQKLLAFPHRYSDAEDNEGNRDNIFLPHQLLEHLEELNLDESSLMYLYNAKLPNLQSLSITSDLAGNFFQHHSTAIPWSQICHLTLSEIFVLSCLLFSVLKQCLHLEYCKIEDPTGHQCTEPFHNITLLNLQSFEVSIFYHHSNTFGVECIQ